MREEKEIYSIVISAHVDKLLWYITYVNNAIFFTPLKKEILLKLNTASDSVKDLFYASFGNVRLLDNLMDAIHQGDTLFAAYVESIAIDSPEASAIKLKWSEANKKTAYYLSELTTYWTYIKWQEMLTENVELFSNLTVSLKKKNYAEFTNTVPICRKIALEMADYMSEGLVIQNKNH